MYNPFHPCIVCDVYILCLMVSAVLLVYIDPLSFCDTLWIEKKIYDLLYSVLILYYLIYSEYTSIFNDRFV